MCKYRDLVCWITIEQPNNQSWQSVVNDSTFTGWTWVLTANARIRCESERHLTCSNYCKRRVFKCVFLEMCIMSNMLQCLKDLIMKFRYRLEEIKRSITYFRPVSSISMSAITLIWKMRERFCHNQSLKDVFFFFSMCSIQGSHSKISNSLNFLPTKKLNCHDLY